jgi:LCP family protein required for cell wall assembly
VVLVVVGGGAAYLLFLNNTVSKNVKHQSLLPTPGVSGAEPAPTKKAAAKEAQNILFIGSDARAGLAGARSDVIVLMHIAGDRKTVTLVHFPRDLYVSVPGHGKDKINAAFAYGGTKLMVQTLESLLGTRMDHVVMVDFEGFIKLTESLGGVTVKNKTAFSSHGFDYPKGEITIAGEKALWFVRERKSLPNGDLDRAENQRTVIKAIVAKGLSPEIIANPAAFTSFIGGVAEHVTVDSTLSDQIIRDLALSLRLTANDITLLQAPISGFGTSPDGQSIDVVDEAQLAALGKAMKSDAMAAYVEKYGDQ